jgi:hypothetical protein
MNAPILGRPISIQFAADIRPLRADKSTVIGGWMTRLYSSGIRVVEEQYGEGLVQQSEDG